MASRTVTGILLDADVLQAVELAADGRRPLVRRAACERLPAEAFADGQLAGIAAVADAVRRLFRSHRLPRRGVCVALGGRLAIARIVEVGEASASEAEQMLQDRISRYAMFENREVLWKAEPLEGGEKRAYLVSAAAEDQVRTLLAALRRAGLQVAHVEPCALASLRSLAACAAPGNPPATPGAGAGDERPTILVALRHESSDFLIVRGAQPLLVRSVEVGLGELARRPQAAEDLVAEATRSVDFCRTRFPQVRPRVWIALASDEATEAAAGLSDRLKRVLADADVEPLPAWPAAVGRTSAASSHAPAAKVAGQTWAAVGAAMVGLGLGEATSRLNLVPADWPERERVQKQVMGAAAGIGLTILVAAGAVVSLRLGVGDAARQAEAASVAMEANTAAVKEVAALRRQAAEAVAQARLWKDVRAQVGPYDWAAGVDGVLGQVPEGVRVREATFIRQSRASESALSKAEGASDGILRLTGDAISTDLVHELVRRLNRLPSVEEANVERLIRSGGAAGQLPGYTITLRFREPPPAPPAPPAPAEPAAPSATDVPPVEKEVQPHDP